MLGFKKNKLEKKNEKYIHGVGKENYARIQRATNRNKGQKGSAEKC